MIFDAEKLKSSDWVEYVLFFGAAWLAFPYILLRSVRFAFLVADNMVGHFVDHGSNLYTITAGKAGFFCVLLFLAGIRCVIHKLVSTTALRWYRVPHTSESV